MSVLTHLLDLTRRHDDDMQVRIDLVASNSWISHWVRLTMGSLLANSYCIGLPGSRIYGGCDVIDAIEREVIELATELFGCRHGVVQFLSGMQANLAAYHAILRPGDTIVTAPERNGGHYSHNIAGPLRFFSPRILPVPFDARRYNIDLERLDALLAAEHPRLLVVGWSEFLFPHPLETIRALCDCHGTFLMHDMSHVAGLLAGGVFQPDAGRIADIVTSSTGKSLHGPDHGLCLYNRDELTGGVLEALMPLLTSNTHPQEIAALGVALTEMKAFETDHAKQVVRNSKALGKALSERSVNALYGELDFSESHTLLIACDWSDLAIKTLDQAGISTNTTPLPWDEGEAPGGIRIGTQVVTRRGMREAEMEAVADAIAQVLLHRQDPLQVRRNLVTPLAQAHRRVRFSFDGSFPMAEDWQTCPDGQPTPS
jgi:glycine hydroxymethyltransferase